MDGELNTSSGKKASETTSFTSLGMSKHSDRSTYRCIGMFGSVKVAIPTTAQIIGRVSDTYWLTAGYTISSGGTLILSTDTRSTN